MAIETTIMDTEIWTVWVGGIEVTDYLMSFDEAVEIANYWVSQGYGDTVIDICKQV